MINSFIQPRPGRVAAVSLAVILLAGCAAPASSIGQTAVPGSATATATPRPANDGAEEFAALEETYDARLGVYAVDTGTGTEVAWRDDERFAYASTVKAMAAAALLDTVGIEGLAESVPIEASDIVTYSPVTETRVGATMTLAEIASAAVTRSDNTAGNLLFEALGGPEALDAKLTELGDDTTVVTRIEPELNEAVPGDDRDTTTPRTFATNLSEYLLGDQLDDAEKAQLQTWLTGTQTGATLVRANLPTDWVVGDKSGAGGYGTRNDLAIVLPPNRDPIVISVMSSRDAEDAEYDDQLIAEAAAAAVAALDSSD